MCKRVLPKLCNAVTKNKYLQDSMKGIESKPLSILDPLDFAQCTKVSYKDNRLYTSHVTLTAIVIKARTYVLKVQRYQLMIAWICRNHFLISNQGQTVVLSNSYYNLLSLVRDAKE